jgi:sodium/potassium-transporting ATPase subunit alpha
MSTALMYEKAESDLMKRKPRNVRLSPLIDWKFFAHVYLFTGVIFWVSCFGMYFLYWSELGFGFYDLMFVFERWDEGYLGHTLKDLNNWISSSQGVFYVRYPLHLELTFQSISVMQLGSIFAIRNRRVSILESNPIYGPRQNLVLLLCIPINLFVTAMNVYVSSAPGVEGGIFQIGHVPVKYWVIPLPLALGLLIADEVREIIVRVYPNSFFAYAAW